LSGEGGIVECHIPYEKEASMQAMVIRSTAIRNSSKKKDVERFELGPGEVLVRVLASAVNPLDTKQQQVVLGVGPNDHQASTPQTYARQQHSRATTR